MVTIKGKAKLALLLIVLILSGCTKQNQLLVIPMLVAEKTFNQKDIQWEKYPVIDFKQVPKKDLEVVASYPYDNWATFSKDSEDFPDESKVAGNYLFITHASKKLFCIDIQAKKILWKDSKNAEHYTNGQIKNSTCIDINEDQGKNWIVSLNIQTDQENWKLELSNANSGEPDLPKLLYWGKNQLSVLLRANITPYKLVSIDTKNGKFVWEKPIDVRLGEASSEHPLFDAKGDDYVFEYIEDLQFLPPYIVYFKEKNMVEIYDMNSGQVLPNKNLKVKLYPYYWKFFDSTKPTQILREGFRKNNIQQENDWNRKCRFLKKLTEMEKISVQYLPRFSEKGIAIFRIDDTAIDGSSYLSGIDLTQLKEIWRIKLVDPENTNKASQVVESTELQFSEIESLPDRVYMKYGDFDYEIEVKTGKIPWKIQDNYFNPMGFNSDPEGNFHYINKLYCLDYKNRKIQWAVSLENGGIWDYQKPYPIVDPVYFRLKGYLDVDRETGNLEAFYPKIMAEDKIGIIDYSGNYRFLYDWDKKTIFQCVVE